MTYTDIAAECLGRNQVSMAQTGLESYYPNAPYHPGQAFPEMPEGDTDPANPIYGWVRETLHRLGLDAAHWNTPEWNPLGDVIQPGMTVFVKPNTVRHYHVGGGDIDSVIVHASVIRPFLDYINLALKGDGRIIIGDSQVTEGRFDEALAAAGIDRLLEWYGDQKYVPLECFDLRINQSVRTWMYGKWGRETIEKDPRGYQMVDLGDTSYFKDCDPDKLRIGIASYKSMRKHHGDGRHEYLFPNSVLHSDVIINIAKLKTHRRTAITLAIKNFMGLPALKDSLPHFQVGSPEEGGDQYIHRSWRKSIGTRLHDIIQTNPCIPVKFVTAVAKKLLWNSHRIIPFRDDVYEAMWPGNDTVWRTLLDLHRVAYYADKEGQLRDAPQRIILHFIDGIIGGELDGPVSPDPVKSGVFLAGYNPVALDCVASTLMGFDPAKIRLLVRGLEDAAHDHPLYFGSREDIAVHLDGDVVNLDAFGERYNLHFKEHPGWTGSTLRE